MITQSQADCIIEANMSSVLKNKAGELVSLDIINPKKSPLFKEGIIFVSI